MATKQRDDIVYEFEDLRRNEDPVPGSVLEQFGLEEEDLEANERHDDKKKGKKDEELDEDVDLDEEVDEEEEEEYDPIKMTREMQKRIARVKRSARQEVIRAKEEAGATISKLEKRVDELERSGKTERIDEEFSERISDLEGQIETAMEKGDSKQVAALTRELAEATADAREKKAELKRQQQRKDEEEEEDDPDDKKIIPRAQQWLNEQDWWDDDEYSDVRAYVRKADMALQKKGYRPTDDDFYERLESLVEKKHPGVITLTMDDEFGELDDLDDEDDLDEDDDFEEIPDKRQRKKRTRSRRRSPVSEGDRGGTARSKKKLRKKKGKTLTRARIANMRAFGMDPENPQHVEAYLEGI